MNEINKKIRIGAAYYPEVWSDEVIEDDISKMKELGVNVVRMGEFAWSTMEKREGEFDLSLFVKIVRKLADNDIDVIMCTPSATPPKWLTDKYEETLMMSDQGVRKQFGARCHPCKSSSIMREKNRIIVTEMCKALKDEKNIIAWQIDNEIMPHRGCYCPLCKKNYQKYLKEKYKTISALNKAWGTARWSLEYKDFEDIIPPREDTWNHPSLYVEWIKFHSALNADYIAEQVKILKEYFSVPISTDMAPYMEQNFYDTNRACDIMMFNHYERAQDLFMAGFWSDFIRPIKNQPFVCTETQINWNGSVFAQYGYRPRGNAYINTWLPIAKGGVANLYWHWREHFAGHEIGHGAVLSASGRYCYNAGEIKQAADDFEKCNKMLTQTKVKSKIALHFSATAYLELLHAPLAKGLDYQKLITENYYKPLLQYNVDVIDTPHNLDGYEVVISPFLSCVDENGLKEKIIKFVQEGGVWIAGPMTDIMKGDATKYQNAPYGFLEDFAGVYTKFTMPIEHDGFRAHWSNGENLNVSFTFDGYELKGAKSLAVYENDYPEGLSVITTKTVGKGRIILVGGLIDGKDVVRLIEAFTHLKPVFTASENVALVERGDYVIALEIENKKGTIVLDKNYFDVLNGKTLQGSIDIEPYTVMVLKNNN